MCTTRLSGHSGRGEWGVQVCVCVCVCVSGGVCLGVSAQGSVHPMDSEADTPIACWDTPPPIACWDTHPHPLWTEWQTDGCKNITFPQLRLWAVKSWCTWRYEPGALAFLYLFQRSSKSWNVKATAFESVSVLHSRYLHKLVTRW